MSAMSMSLALGRRTIARQLSYSAIIQQQIKHDRAEAPSSTVPPTKRAWRQAMRLRRKQYAQEIQATAKQKEVLAEQKQAVENEKAEQLRHMEEVHKEEQIKHESELIHELEMQAQDDKGSPQVESITSTPTARELSRKANREKQQEQVSQQRLLNLIKLYHSAADFVDHSNLDSKIEEIFSSTPPLVYSDNLESLKRQHANNARLTQRLSELQEIMNDTVLNDKTGPGFVQQWAEKQQQQ